ncbi:hypothetical protein [Spartinivicinus ruber]|uniref:hypothetical protein n=1 Tax=Spartinivicinus ruber TaxID=2683272 RepID=UPI0013D328FC|nr:hypothetical protein [Spartinivicinus ruber]
MNNVVKRFIKPKVTFGLLLPLSIHANIALADTNSIANNCPDTLVNAEGNSVCITSINSPLKALIFANSLYSKQTGNKKIVLSDKMFDRLFFNNLPKNPAWFVGLYTDIRSIDEIQGQLKPFAETVVFAEAATLWNRYTATQSGYPANRNLYTELARQLGYEKMRTMENHAQPWNEIAKGIATIDRDIYTTALRIHRTSTTMKAKFALAAQYLREDLKASQGNSWVSSYQAILDQFLEDPTQLTNSEKGILLDTLKANLHSDEYRWNKPIPGVFRLARLAFDMKFAEASDYNYFQRPFPYSGAACLPDTGKHKFDDSYTTRLCTPDISNKLLYQRWYLHTYDREYIELTRPSEPKKTSGLAKLIGLLFAFEGLGGLELFEALEAEALAEEEVVTSEEAALAEEEYAASLCRL